MKIDIRENIISNFKDSQIDEIKNCVEASINEKDEITLPGLGVFFEILWKHSNENDRLFILNTIHNNL